MRRECPKCGTPMVQWGFGRMERWRCPACYRKRRKTYHRTVEVKGAPLDEASFNTEPHLEDRGVTLYHGDCLEVLGRLPDCSVDMAATSPPFYGLRNYGVSGQIGLEETLDEYISRLVAVFAEVRRVLRDEGVCWVEIGDAYAATSKGTGGTGKSTLGEASGGHAISDEGRQRSQETQQYEPRRYALPEDVKVKDLFGVPWELAFALRADGWWLRSEIIWDKPNAMPESVTDRPTRGHSTIFLLSKSARYWYDADAIPTPHQRDGRSVTTVVGQEGSIQHRNGERWPGDGANARSVWSVSTGPRPTRTSRCGLRSSSNE